MTPRLPAPTALLTALLFATPAILTAQDGPGARALEAASERFATVTSFCADFAQELEVTLLRQVTKANGRLCQKRPNLFSMRFAEPEGDEIVADGTFFWIHLKSESPNQVVQIPMSNRPGFDFYREFLESPFERYAVTEAELETVEGDELPGVVLVPRAATTDWTTASVWIDPDTRLIRRVAITEPNGTIRRVLLTDFDLTPRLAPDIFDYTPPAGANVVQMGGA